MKTIEQLEIEQAEIYKAFADMPEGAERYALYEKWLRIIAKINEARAGDFVKQGRPPIDGEKRINTTFAITPTNKEKLAAYAKRERVSLSQAINDLIGGACSE